MNHKQYIVFSSVIFGLVGLMHLFRAIQGWPYEVAGNMLPMAGSWAIAVSGVLLSLWGFRLARR